jgi:hypothetical protein
LLQFLHRRGRGTDTLAIALERERFYHHVPVISYDAPPTSISGLRVPIQKVVRDYGVKAVYDTGGGGTGDDEAGAGENDGRWRRPPRRSQSSGRLGSLRRPRGKVGSRAFGGNPGHCREKAPFPFPLPPLHAKQVWQSS